MQNNYCAKWAFIVDFFLAEFNTDHIAMIRVNFLHSKLLKHGEYFTPYLRV